MAKITMNAEIREVNRYSFTVEVDDNLTEEQQDEQGKAKLSEFLDNNIPYPFQREAIGGVICDDCETSMRSEEVISIEVNQK
jgi:hypothetical protein